MGVGVGGQCHALATFSPGNTLYPLYRRLGGPQGQSEWMRKILLPPEFDPWTVQPVESCYTDYAILAHPKYWQPPTKLHSAISHIPEGCSLEESDSASQKTHQDSITKNQLMVLT